MDSRHEYFELLASEWDALQSPQRHDRLRQILSSFDPFLCSARSILEVGTGTGALLPHLLEFAPRAMITAIDLANAMLTRAQIRTATPLFAQADVHALPFSADEFDAIICHGSFPHFRNKPGALGELKRTLVAGAPLIIFHGSSRETINGIHEHARDDVIHGDLLPCGQEMCEMLGRAGFVKVTVHDEENSYRAFAHKPG
jgi:ubiquinone/menaquinone biosynthesis C-methylase UbiE